MQQNPLAIQRRNLRHLFRQRRRSLTPEQQQQAEIQICEKALAFINQHQAQNIALYLAVDGEIGTATLIERLWAEGKEVCLPVLHPFSLGHLLFLRYRPDSVLQANKFNINEPKLDIRDVIPSHKLDIIFTPLVAFDQAGNRLGMGGGFYDRTLCDWQCKSFLPIGLAHQCQQLERLPAESWDIPLAHILSA
ncbi:5-formyltetrahydrofolate cyclo-ligase [Mesocricetibacter intestinalis]|uniref:5-formyltetrahydrofolate cyclo-ligase n=1 Tax=Mesocricetibacter intestinalis TaxID=1521930 RepID=A0A4R6VIB0_9PAST|nr:5-formyltetrahydrofolate cyclo-ligase [Mesocricetibacter intestinalis]TDQ58104.1 5-formyltetrahydrofolate cyclo-ligase [Mesocricetibacter intestinalis]